MSGIIISSPSSSIVIAKSPVMKYIWLAFSRMSRRSDVPAFDLQVVSYFYICLMMGRCQGAAELWIVDNWRSLTVEAQFSPQFIYFFTSFWRKQNLKLISQFLLCGFSIKQSKEDSSKCFLLPFVNTFSWKLKAIFCIRLHFPHCWYVLLFGKIPVINEV